MIEPVNGRNPLVDQARQIHLTVPGEEYDWTPPDDEYDEEEDMGEARSEDEAMARPPRRKRRLPPMPKTPDPERGPVFDPPFEVLPDGTVTGPKIAQPGDPPGEETYGLDPAKGSMELAAKMMMPR